MPSAIAPPHRPSPLPKHPAARAITASKTSSSQKDSLPDDNSADLDSSRYGEEQTLQKTSQNSSDVQGIIKHVNMEAERPRPSRESRVTPASPASVLSRPWPLGPTDPTDHRLKDKPCLHAADAPPSHRPGVARDYPVQHLEFLSPKLSPFVTPQPGSAPGETEVPESRQELAQDNAALRNQVSELIAQMRDLKREVRHLRGDNEEMAESSTTSAITERPGESKSKKSDYAKGEVAVACVASEITNPPPKSIAKNGSESLKPDIASTNVKRTPKSILKKKQGQRSAHEDVEKENKFMRPYGTTRGLPQPPPLPPPLRPRRSRVTFATLPAAAPAVPAPSRPVPYADIMPDGGGWATSEGHPGGDPRVPSAVCGSDRRRDACK